MWSVERTAQCRPPEARQPSYCPRGAVTGVAGGRERDVSDEIGKDADHLERFQRRQTIIRDRVRGVAGGHYPGAYIFGPAGTGKTHTVRTALRTIGAPHVYHSGHVTPMGLFELLAEHPSSTLVLDDVGAVLTERVGL